MKKIGFTILVVGFVGLAFGANRQELVKERQRCINLIQKAASVKKQPNDGVFEINFPEKEHCKEIFTTELPPTSNDSKFVGYTRACLHRSSMDDCKKILKQVKKINNIRNGNGTTLLMQAAMEGDVRTFEFLVKNGAGFKAVDHEGNTVLHYALSPDLNNFMTNDSVEIEQRMVKIVSEITKNGGAPQEINAFGESAFWRGVQNNVPQTVLNVLKRNGIKPNLSFVSFNRFLSVDNDVVPPPLYLAIRMRNVEMVKWLLENGTNVHFQYGILTMWQALWQDEYEALTSGQVIDNSESTKKRDEIAKMLLASKINPNAKLFDSYSVFAIAVRSNASEELINAFLDAGVSLSKLEFNGPWTPMPYIISSGSNILLKKMLSMGYKVNTRFNMDGMISDDKESTMDALSLAIFVGNEKMVQMLLSAKANPNAEQVGGNTPLCVALAPQNLADSTTKIQMLKSLLKFKANPNKTFGISIPLGLAIETNNADAVELLIKAKANVNAKLLDGSSMLEYAEEFGDEKIIQLLKKAGATVPFSGSFIEYCLQNPNMTEKMVLDAIKQGADVNEVSSDGLTPLHVLAGLGKNIKVMQILIKKGAFVNAMTENGETPLLYAARQNPNPEFLKMLIAAGADVEAKNSEDWNALLMAAVFNKSPKVLEFLLKTSLADNLSESAKTNLIRTAVKYNPNPKVLISLFKAGFKPEPGENYWGDKPLHVAIQESKDLEFIKILLQGKAKVDDKAMNLARELPMDTKDEIKYRNKVIDMLTKAKRR
jgi:ankyrin repeat protein